MEHEPKSPMAAASAVDVAAAAAEVVVASAAPVAAASVAAAVTVTVTTVYKTWVSQCTAPIRERIHTSQSVVAVAVAAAESVTLTARTAVEDAAADEEASELSAPDVPKGKVLACEPFVTDFCVAGSKNRLGSLAGS